MWQVPQVPLKQKYQQSRVLAYKYPPPQTGLLNSHSDLAQKWVMILHQSLDTRFKQELKQYMTLH